MNLPHQLYRLHEDIQAQLKAVVYAHNFPLYNMLAYHLGWKDEHGEEVNTESKGYVHSTLCLLASEAVGGESKYALQSAAAVELVNQFSLIHSDIQDAVSERNHRPTVWWVWGPAQAINAGDAMHALARLSLLQQSDNSLTVDKTLEAVRVLDLACLRLCEGRYLDLLYRERLDISMESYFQMAERKSAALMSCSTEVGALTASSDNEVVRALSTFGLKLGLASNIRNEISDLWDFSLDDRYFSGDLLSKKKSLPIIYALQNASGGAKHDLGDVYFKRVMEPSDLPKLIAVLDSLNAREYSQNIVETLYNEAVESLNLAKIPPDKLKNLTEFADWILT